MMSCKGNPKTPDQLNLSHKGKNKNIPVILDPDTSRQPTQKLKIGAKTETVLIDPITNIVRGAGNNSQEITKNNSLSTYKHN